MIRWCLEPGSNRYAPYAGKRRILSPLCLPISPSRHAAPTLSCKKPGGSRCKTEPANKRLSPARSMHRGNEWSGRRVSNSRPQPWQGCALPTELLPHGVWRRGPESNRPTRICNPVHNRFATAPEFSATTSQRPVIHLIKKGSFCFPFRNLEREKSLELSTSTLARLRSTN